MGSILKASPAKTTIPTLSLSILSIVEEINCFAHSKRLGETSSASILLEMSRAITTSIPCFFSLSTVIPICGRARATINMAAANKAIRNFICCLLLEASGIRTFINCVSPKRFSLRLREMQDNIYIIAHSARSKSKYRYLGSSNLNMIRFSFMECACKQLFVKEFQSTETI